MCAAAVALPEEPDDPDAVRLLLADAAVHGADRRYLSSLSGGPEHGADCVKH